MHVCTCARTSWIDCNYIYLKNGVYCQTNPGVFFESNFRASRRTRRCSPNWQGWDFVFGGHGQLPVSFPNFCLSGGRFVARSSGWWCHGPCDRPGQGNWWAEVPRFGRHHWQSYFAKGSFWGIWLFGKAWESFHMTWRFDVLNNAPVFWEGLPGGWFTSPIDGPCCCIEEQWGLPKIPLKNSRNTLRDHPKRYNYRVSTQEHGFDQFDPGFFPTKFGIKSFEPRP